MKIMLDAGHYGKRNQSPVVKDYYESERMFKLCDYLLEELKSYGFEVFKTRNDINKDLSVVKRGESAKGCDIFISLHSNAANNEAVNRVDIYSAYDNLNDSHNLGNILVDAIADCMEVPKGSVKTRKSENGDYEYYGVLKGARKVGCPLYYIIEHSFHTNKYAATWLLNDDNLKRLAKIEALTIALFFGFKKKNELGDVNMDGVFDSSDLMLIKRAYFNNIKLSDEQKSLVDFDSDGDFDVFDYIAAKRKFFNS